MVDINLECVHQIEPKTRSTGKQQKKAYLEAVRILLVLLENVLAQPDNSKFRTIRLENKAIKEKLLTLPGCEKLLEAIGFVRAPASNAFTLPTGVSLQQVRKYRDALSDRRSAWLSETVPKSKLLPGGKMCLHLNPKLRFFGRSAPTKFRQQHALAIVYQALGGVSSANRLSPCAGKRDIHHH